MKKILLVNVEIDFHEKYMGLLDRGEYRLFSATTGKEALEIHRQERVDLIITDLEMLEMECDKFCALVRTENELKNVPIILFCRNTPEELERAAQSGANSWLTKPVIPEQLLEIVAQFLSVPVRKDYRVLLKVQTGNGISFLCTSHNISATGILFETEKLLNKGDHLTCTFFLPGPRRIVANGETVRTVTLGEDRYHYGIRFIDLAEEFREEIERFVAEQ